MNKERRRKIRECINQIKKASNREEFEDVVLILEDILFDENESRANVSEGLTYTERYQDSEIASDLLEASIEYLKEIIGFIQDDMHKEVYNYVQLAIASLSDIA